MHMGYTATNNLAHHHHHHHIMQSLPCTGIYFRKYYFAFEVAWFNREMIFVWIEAAILAVTILLLYGAMGIYTHTCT